MPVSHRVFLFVPCNSLKLGIVGKGLLMDTGGYNIKVRMMETMKSDCGGAAAILGAARAIAQLEPEGVEVHFVIAACEVSAAFAHQSRGRSYRA